MVPRLFYSKISFKTSLYCVRIAYIISYMRKRQSQFHIYFDKDVLDRLMKVAKEEGRTVTELIREAVAELLSDRERGKPRRRDKQ